MDLLYGIVSAALLLTAIVWFSLDLLVLWREHWS